MSAPLPENGSRRELKFKNGTAIGTSNRWQKGQYCSILTEAGIVGCGIYDLKAAARIRPGHRHLQRNARKTAGRSRGPVRVENRGSHAQGRGDGHSHRHHAAAKRSS